MAENTGLLFSGVIRKEPDAISELFRRFQPRMFNFAMQFVHDESDAKDIVQDSFISFWEHCDKIAVPAAVPSYLFTSLKNMCLKHVRREAVKSRFDNISDLILKEKEIAYFGDSRNILDDIYFEELSCRYAEALKKLPPRSREIFMMSRGEGLPHKEISRKLNISVRTVENEIYRGLKLLKNELKEPSAVVVLLLSGLFMNIWK